MVCSAIVLFSLMLRSPSMIYDKIQAEQFLQLIHSLHEQTQSVSFVYEGESLFIGPENLHKGFETNDMGSWFQYAFVSRHDGALVLEGFHGSRKPGSLTYYEKFALLGDRLESSAVAPDMPSGTQSVQVRKATSVSFAGDKIPVFYFVHLFQGIKATADLGYECHEWENVGDHKCLVVSLDKFPRSLNPTVPRYKFWIDLERGGHPLRVEVREGKDLVEKFDDIKLFQVRSRAGAELWVPVSGRCLSYGWNGRYFSEPVVTKNAYIVQGIIKVDEQLIDSIFSVAAKSLLPRTSSLENLEKKFKDELEAHRPETDPESVRLALDRRLLEANQQATELSASAPSRSWPIGRWVVQASLTLLGTVCLLAAYRKFKS